MPSSTRQAASRKEGSYTSYAPPRHHSSILITENQYVYGIERADNEQEPTIYSVPSESGIATDNDGNLFFRMDEGWTPSIYDTQMYVQATHPQNMEWNDGTYTLNQD